MAAYYYVTYALYNDYLALLYTSLSIISLVLLSDILLPFSTSTLILKRLSTFLSRSRLTLPLASLLRTRALLESYPSTSPLFPSTNYSLTYNLLFLRCLVLP